MRHTGAAALLLALAVIGCGSDDDADLGAAEPESFDDVGLPTAPDVTEQPTAPRDEVTIGPVTVLAYDYGLVDATGWQTAAVFDLTNEGGDIIAVPYRLRVESADGSTVATSDGTDAVVLEPGKTITVVQDGLDPTGPSAPAEGTVTVYGRTGQPAANLVGEPEWASSNETLDCNNGLVGCGLTGDLTYDGPSMTAPGIIQVVAYRGDAVVAAGHVMTEVPDVLPGETIPYAGQITLDPSFDGSGVTRFAVTVEQISEGD